MINRCGVVEKTCVWCVVALPAGPTHMSTLHDWSGPLPLPGPAIGPWVPGEAASPPLAPTGPTCPWGAPREIAAEDRCRRRRTGLRSRATGEGRAMGVVDVACTVDVVSARRCSM